MSDREGGNDAPAWLTLLVAAGAVTISLLLTLLYLELRYSGDTSHYTPTSIPTTYGPPPATTGR